MTNKLERCNRAAEFSIDIDIMESGMMGKVFAYMEFTPIKVECIHYGRVYELVGLSPMFDEAEEGMMWPRVDLDIDFDQETGELKSVKIRK